MLKREWGAESNGKLPYLFILSKIATLVPKFVVKHLSLGRTAILVHAFAVKDLPLGKHSDGMITGDECGPNFLTFILRLRETPAKISTRILTPIGDRTRARCVKSNDVTPRLQRWSEQQRWNASDVTIRPWN